MSLRKWLAKAVAEKPMEEPQGNLVASITINERHAPAHSSPDYVVDFGTSATVVAAFRPPVGKESFAPLFLIGGTTPFASIMTVDKKGQEVLAIGGDAPESYRADRANRRIHGSLKRYIELQARTEPDAAIRQASVVQQYLVKALASRYSSPENQDWTLRGNSQVFVSVPNSFNSIATRIVRDGVRFALGQLAGFAINQNSVHVIREGEAVAHLWAMDPDGQRFESTWVPVRTDGKPEDDIRQTGRTGLVAVLDVGAGTTDLTVFRVPRNGDRPKTLMNGGVPIGGADLDKLLLTGIAPGGYWRDKGIDSGVKAFAENDVKARKEERFDTFFTGDDVGGWHASLVEQHGLRGAALPNQADSERIVKDGLKALVSTSIDGLFDLIPQSVTKETFDVVLLTGRGSQIPAIREAVVRRARALGAQQVKTLRNYALKLAVAHGCMAFARGFDTTDADLRWQKLPSSTFGRRLSIVSGRGRNERSKHLEANALIANDLPTLWRQSALIRDARWNERRANPRSREDVHLQEGLGLIRRIADQKSIHRGSLFVLLASDDEYYLHDHAAWTARQQAAFTKADINPLTKLPFGFPYENEP